jgi:hypothetical protein
VQDVELDGHREQCGRFLGLVQQAFILARTPLDELQDSQAGGRFARVNREQQATARALMFSLIASGSGRARPRDKRQTPPADTIGERVIARLLASRRRLPVKATVRRPPRSR